MQEKPRYPFEYALALLPTLEAADLGCPRKPSLLSSRASKLPFFLHYANLESQTKTPQSTPLSLSLFDHVTPEAAAHLLHHLPNTFATCLKSTLFQAPSPPPRTLSQRNFETSLLYRRFY